VATLSYPPFPARELPRLHFSPRSVGTWFFFHPGAVFLGKLPSFFSEAQGTCLPARSSFDSFFLFFLADMNSVPSFPPLLVALPFLFLPGAPLFLLRFGLRTTLPPYLNMGLFLPSSPSPSLLGPSQPLFFLRRNKRLLFTLPGQGGSSPPGEHAFSLFLFCKSDPFPQKNRYPPTPFSFFACGLCCPPFPPFLWEAGASSFLLYFPQPVDSLPYRGQTATFFSPLFFAARQEITSPTFRKRDFDPLLLLKHAVALLSFFFFSPGVLYSEI